MEVGVTAPVGESRAGDHQPPAGGRRVDGYVVVKRLLDLFIASAALILLSPVFALVAIAVKLDSRGPLFYRRRVVAQNGLAPHSIDLSKTPTFDAFKFRTMQVDADEVLTTDQRLFDEYRKEYKLENDPRVTRIGQFLRKTNLDELPQFINVLAGQMSVVGPRIVTRPELERYGRLAGKLLSVRPGMSGLWQVLRGSDHSYDKRITLDMLYIRRRSTRFDLKIVLLTIRLMLGMRGSG